MFGELAQKFNGDLLPILEAEHVIEQHHLDLLRSFLGGKETLATGQRALWPLYDFGVIPIQLISAVYERLLHATDIEGAREAGAFYTPHGLVELLLNEVLPWPSADARPRRDLPTVIDPSCGSGVFLVEAFRRLVAMRYGGRPRNVSPDELASILVECIHGIDQHESAIRIAAFSLYLAMMDYLDARAIWDTLRFPRLTKRTNAGAPNLSASDAFAMARSGATFDIVVGNPPWRRGRLPKTALRWCAETDFPGAGEVAQAFLWLAGHLARDRIAMLAPSKWLFNKEAPDVKFRRTFFKRFGVETILNLSALRRGKSQIFANAVGPATAVITRLSQTPRSDTVVYCTPQPGVQQHVPTALLIDATDVKLLPRQEAESRDDVWKILIHGTWRDIRLVRRLVGASESLDDFIDARKDRGWISGRGFQPWKRDSKSAKPRKLKSNPRLAALPHVHAKDLERFVAPDARGLSPWGADGFNWTGLERGRPASALGMYEKPHVLVKEGQSDGRFCAAFSHYACSFQDTITGIHGPSRDERLLKALTAYLNSAVASYVLFMTSSTWGVERPRVKKGEMLSLPALPLLRAPTVRALSSLIDAYARAEAGERRAIEKQIDEAVFDCFDLSAAERSLVADATDVYIDHVQRGPASKAVQPPSLAQMKAYAAAFGSVWEQMLGGKPVRAELHFGRAPLAVASFELFGRSPDRERLVVRQDEAKLSALLADLERRLWSREGHSLFRRRQVRIFERDAVHIVKPAELRFWTRSAAFQDADSTLAQGVTGTLDGDR